MKKCSRCHEPKEDGDFYSKDYYCKACRYEINHNRVRNTPILYRDKPFSPGEPSTKLAMEILRERGIPCVAGSATGRKWVDLMAWACVPIEAKLSGPNKDNPNKFVWSFTGGEMQRGFDGLFMFIAKTQDDLRVFIVPSDVEWAQTNGKPNKNSISVTFGSDHFNAYMEDEISQYEGAFHLIENMRRQWR